MRSTPSRSVASRRRGSRCGLRGGKFQGAMAWNQSEGRSLFVIEIQAREIFRLEAEMNVVGEVALQRALRHVQLDRGGFGNFAQALQSGGFPPLKIRHPFGRDRVATPRP